MWDDQNDKDMMRNQIFAMILITVLFFVWINYFVPSPPPVEPAEPGAAPSAAAEPGAAQDGHSASEGPAAIARGPGEQWPYLPAVPEIVDPTDDEVIIHGNDLALVFTRIGGRLKEANVLLADEAASGVQLVPDALGAPDTETEYPLGLTFSDDAIGDELNRRRFDYALDPSGRAVVFSLELPGVAVIHKQFRLAERSHVLEVEIDYESLEPEPRALGLDVTPAYTLDWAPGLLAENEGGRFQPALLWRRDQANEQLLPKDVPEAVDASGLKRVPAAEWVGFRTKYFLAAIKPEFEASDGWIGGDASRISFAMSVPKFNAQPAMVQRNHFSVYLGPVHLSSLREAWPTLPTALRFFTKVDFMDGFAKLLLRNLNWWHGFIPSYGIAIILLTLLVRGVMFPLTIRQMKSAEKMKALGPELKELQEKYKEDQQELGRKTMEFYRERGINPLAGCFPLLLQMPIFIALYRMLLTAYELRGAPFLWIDDLSRPDCMIAIPAFQDVPILGYIACFNALPILSAVAMIVNMKVVPVSGPASNPQQKMMMTIMPVFMAIVMYSFPAGTNLYVLTSTVLGVAQQFMVRPFLNKEDTQAPVVKKPDKRKKRKQHFYNRAQERKRQMAKEARKKQKTK